MDLTRGQREAIRQAIEWYYDDRSRKENIFVISGGAGTGKSTTVSTLVQMLGLMKYQVLYVTPTGKATVVLRSKGCIANTIHKTFYTMYKSKTGKVMFSKKKNMASTIKLIVIDEVSMVNDKIMKDIISFGIPIIALGDHNQLPPVFGSNPYILKPNYILTEIMRQKNDSGILKLANMAKDGTPIPLGTYNESDVINFTSIKDIEKYDVVLCWKNSTRRQLNTMIRNKLGRTSIYPQANEKIMCLKNNYNYTVDYDLDIPIFLVNGLVSNSLSPGKVINEDYFTIDMKPDFFKNELYFEDVICKRSTFDKYLDNNFTDDEDYDENEEAVDIDFGYAYTTHKSQGSEWKNVLVIDEFKGSDDIYNKWLYTSITRSSGRVTIAYSPGGV